MHGDVGDVGHDDGDDEDDEKRGEGTMGHRRMWGREMDARAQSGRERSN